MMAKSMDSVIGCCGRVGGAGEHAVAGKAAGVTGSSCCISNRQRSLRHPAEIYNLLRFKMGGCRAVMSELDQVWSKYGEKLSDLAKPENIVPAVQCLNELITNALSHVPDVLTYLSALKNKQVFKFFAILHVMAIATLSACYNNQQVFKGVVKISKAQTGTIMMDATNMEAVKALMLQYIEEIYHKIPPTDPTADKTQHVTSSIRSQCLPTSSVASHNHSGYHVRS